MGEPALPPAPRWKGRGARKAARATPIGGAIQRLRNLATQAPELSRGALRPDSEHRSVHTEHRIRALAVGDAALAHVDSRQLGALGDAAFGRLAASSACCGCSLAYCPGREDCLLAARVSWGPHSAGTIRSTGEGRAGAGRDRACNEEPCCSAPATAGEDSSAGAGRAAQGCGSPVVHHDVHLSLEEAFFLQHALGALQVLRPCPTAHGRCAMGDREGQEPREEGAANGRGEGPNGATSEGTQGEAHAQAPVPSTCRASPEGPWHTTEASTNGVPQASAECAGAMQLMSTHELRQASAETVLMHQQPMSAPELCSLGSQAHPQFGLSCVGFWHLRAKNWVLRGGAQYGADFTAYQQHPNLVHSSYLVFVTHAQPSAPTAPALESATQPAEPWSAPLGGCRGEGRVRQWEDFQALVRVAASVAKRVLLLRVTEVPQTSDEVPGEAALLEGGSLSRVVIPGVGTYRVLEIEVHRWLAERGREAHEY